MKHFSSTSLEAYLTRDPDSFPKELTFDTVTYLLAEKRPSSERYKEMQNFEIPEE